MLKEEFLRIIQPYAGEINAVALWKEIATSYTRNQRHYHNLAHLDHLYEQLLLVKDKILDWEVIVLSTCYHDIVYNIRSKHNEEKSALFAATKLAAIQFPSDRSALCVQQIIATKQHLHSENSDTNYFIDADLSILGTSTNNYLNYTIAIRKEYTFYPDLLYKPGRKNVLQHFLQMDRIFKTPEFFSLYEQQARLNLQSELEQL